MSDHYIIVNSKGVSYHLNSKAVMLRGGKVQTIYYFSRDVRDTACEIPEGYSVIGYSVIENPRNGFCTLKRDAK